MPQLAPNTPRQRLGGAYALFSNVSRANWLAVICGVFGVCTGALVLIGWYLHAPELVQLRPDWAPMQFNTGLCFFLAAAALIAAALGQTRVPLFVGPFVALVGLVSGLQYGFSVNLGIDELLFDHHILVQTSSPGRMAPNTAMCFVLLGWGMFLMGYRLRRMQPSSVAIMLASLCVGLALVALAGYVTGFKQAYGWAQFTSMAVHTAVTFVALGVGVTAFHWPRASETGMDISRLTGVLISVTTMGVLLIVMVAAAIGLIPFYDQIRTSQAEEVSNRLLTEVSQIQRQFERTEGLAQDLSSDDLDRALISKLELSQDSKTRLANALAQVRSWPGPGQAHLGMLQSNGAGVLGYSADGQLQLNAAQPVVAQAIARGVRGERGVASDDDEEKLLAFFAPVPNTSWVAVSTVPAAQLYAEADQKLVLIGMIVMLVALCGAFGMARLMQPLTSGILVHSAELEHRVDMATREIQANLAKLEEKNRELEQFSYVVSHDLQAPLRGIDGFAALLQRKHAASLNEEGLEFLAFIRDGTSQMREFIQGFLQFSRLGSRGQPLVPVNLDELLVKLKSQLGFSLSDAQTELVVEPLPQVMGDAAQLNQLFQNLIENAIKFRKLDIPSVIRVGAHRQEQRCKITVSDNGIGIAADEREAVFKMFSRAKSTESLPGTGIGLALCKKIVERHGGEIEIVDRPAGSGTTFAFDLAAAS